MLTLIALAACIRPEEGVDDSHIQGTVVVPAYHEDEGAQKNDKATEARDLGVLPIGYTVAEGEVDDFAEHTDGSPGDDDTDWFALMVDTKVEGAILVHLGADDPPPQLPTHDTGHTDTGVTDTGADTDTSVVDTDTSDTSDTSIDTSDTAWDSAWDSATETVTPPVIEVAIFDLTDSKAPAAVGDAVVIDADGGEVPFAFEPGVPYGVRVNGVVGDGPAAYRLAIPGLHPDAAGIKVGAYQSSDPLALGAPVGGTTPRAFALNEDFSFTGEYEVVFINSFTRDPVDTDVVEVNSDIPEVWLYAATWPNLNAGLRSGTFYSSTPAHVTLGDSSYYVAEPALVLDAYAEAQDGVTIAEEEPNDIDLDLDPLDFSPAQTLEGLSPAGFLDTITGTVTWTGVEAGTGAHDLDTFHVNVSTDAYLYGALGWDDGSDVDWYLLDATGETLDGAASYDNPEVGGGYLLTAGTDYYVMVVGYSAEDPLVETPYAFTIEWGAP